MNVIDAPYVPSRGDFKITPTPLGSALCVSVVGKQPIFVFTSDEAESAITTIIEEESERVQALLNMPGLCF